MNREISEVGITILAIFESSVERLITLLEASAKRITLQQYHLPSANDFSDLPWKVSRYTQYLVRQTGGVVSFQYLMTYVPTHVVEHIL